MQNQRRLMQKGKVEISYSSYKINNGLTDAEFR